LCLKHNWSNFDPQGYYLYGEDQNCETSFKDNGLQAAVDIRCKVQVLSRHEVLKPRAGDDARAPTGQANCIGKKPKDYTAYLLSAPARTYLMIADQYKSLL